ncbi:low-density lipoprotein receptor class A domain-containing protein 4 isoform X1 [Chiloscyllium plagiosum]|uniref:low-density lipoprotein receptor class A domain-containing protein 4 isoform X1 n=2 Tax=Chiloscyllium plagiosum TaxID=36176 RepID=UPI001CB819C3|nr:low-density lipoprotein receptor class A domain-containing protein 4 isoform X1 [Chiloscyllium plagiosum]XP_043543644.1 low-density lipoprotein receptor class A domain-containing protein 4 isoform X1 [Chiloscyllium plagiosum]XP_043543645.1 low-density lipoprotein receptor class A domain-containing protein 4 isoform X1 [Chiloscyllium plagiosum]XP_043543646.1 low-density lipoprotein receptor class A domain-containing protein 4 isoform X1 [Chiloscyllium plagiosum]XP_043543647.1 low-density lipo
MQEADLQSTNALKECKFPCTNGNCSKFGNLICNQLNDCGDNNDEENCPLVTEHPPPTIFNSEQEFVKIIVIIVAMTVMVVVIICLLNHYKHLTRSFINRQSQARRQEEALQPEGGLCPTDSTVSHHGASELMSTPRSRDRFTAPSFMQRERCSRFQPMYPYMQHEIDLPPTISLSDGEEPPPYQRLCALQLRDPEQQLELNRESVRAPPNRTIFDSDLINVSMYSGGPRPPSNNSGISATNYSSNGRMEGPPPTYSEVMGHYPGSAFFHHQHNVPPSTHRDSEHHFQQDSEDSTIVPLRGKDLNAGKIV